MAQYKDREHVEHSTASIFDVRRAPGTQTEHPGIYCCYGCSEEVLVRAGGTMPPGHRHSREEGKVEWRLLVLAQPRK